MGLRIVNKTNWNTDQIRALIRRVAQDEMDNGRLKDARITIVYLRPNARTLGWCMYSNPLNPRVRMNLKLPRYGACDPIQLAHVIAHEFAHAKGIRHREMSGPRYTWAKGWKERYMYAADYLIEWKEEIVVTREEKLQSRRKESLAHAEKMVAKWQRQSKRANTMLKKWSQKLKAVQKRLGAETK